MTLDNLLHRIAQLTQDNVRETVSDRITSFHTFQTKPDNAVFLELCFCLLTAHCRAEHCHAIQQTLGPLFLHGTTREIEHELHAHHYRFPPRAAHIVAARQYKDGLTKRLRNLSHDDRRRWLVDTIPGLGLKEASHFLRNIGYDDYAIIDAHILRILDYYQIIPAFRSLTTNHYLQIEEALNDIATKAGLSLAELDLYLWYLDTGIIIK